LFNGYLWLGTKEPPLAQRLRSMHMQDFKKMIGFLKKPFSFLKKLFGFPVFLEKLFGFLEKPSVFEKIEWLLFYSPKFEN
jgi:hypothetical protein